jgi:hypothetical protein
VGPPSSVTGIYGPGQDTGQPQGILASEAPVSKGPGWFEQHYPESFQKRKNTGILDDTTDKSGWMRDERMSDSQNRKLNMANLLINFGKQQQSDDGWGGPLTHY